MTEIKIAFSDESYLKLKELAESKGLSPEDLVQASIIELLNRTEMDFKQAADYVVKKNAELYKRLA